MLRDLAMEEILHRVLDWALTGEDAFSNGDLLAVVQICILLYAFRDRLFSRISLQQLGTQVAGLKADVQRVDSQTHFISGMLQKLHPPSPIRSSAPE